MFIDALVLICVIDVDDHAKHLLLFGVQWEQLFWRGKNQKVKCFQPSMYLRIKWIYFILYIVSYTTNEICFLSEFGSEQKEWYIYATP